MNEINSPDISVIIPAYNETDRIYESLKQTSQVLEKTRYEIIVVDDGSSDSTANQAYQAAKENENIRVFKLPNNRGKGAALIFGCQHAQGELIAFLDADLELHPNLILRLWRIMAESDADVVIGSKRHPDSQLTYPPFRRITSAGYALLNHWLFGMDLRDTQTGIKLFRSQVIKRVINRLKIERYAFDLELLVAISRFGYEIVEAPVILQFQRQHGGRLRLAAITGMFIDTLQILYWSSFWKWLEPSLRMKLWIINFLLGIIIGSFGFAHWLAVHVDIPENLTHLAYVVTLRFLDTALRDWIMMLMGFLLILISGIQLNKGILAAFARADRGYTVDQKYNSEIKKPDIPLPPAE
jgi:dolichol-phosphate mannosyltransferase